MILLPSVLNWSYHRSYGDAWSTSLNEYIAKVANLARKFGFAPMGINIGTGGEQNQLPRRDHNYVAELRKKLEDLGLTPIPIIGTLQIHADAAVVAKSIEALKPTLEISSWLGIEVSTYNLSLHGRLTKEKAVRVYAEAVARLADVAATFGQRICTENYNHFTSDELLLAIERCGKNNVGFLNDIGNWLLLGEDPVSVTRKLAYRTFHVHVKDYHLQDGVWRSVPLGQGIIDIPSILEILAKTPGDAVFLALETDLDEGDENQALVESAAYIKPLLRLNP
ncbi:sugar phosphate isomerase/epimerase family protein [Moorella naiadis]|uniref:sugar phosphate isomerase/epimerase family protein n=1 Tax=Moorella naiadis (nom. illeg.) TaxID=3093670 RepID=UPI003D9CB67C